MYDSKLCLSLPSIEATPLKTQLHQCGSEFTHKEAWNKYLRKSITNKSVGTLEIRIPVLPG